MSAVIEAQEPSARYLADVQPPLVRQFDLLATALGGVARLRMLILALAVQGKLVPQDRSDESAATLLKTIRSSVEKLEAREVTKRGKPVAPIERSDEPFALPPNWEWVPLGEVIEIVRGITFPASEKTKEPGPRRIACLRTANVQTSIEWDDLLFVDRSFMGREEQLIHRHDIVMSMANSRELVGKVAIVEEIPHTEATFGGFLGVLRPRQIDPRYVMALLRTPYARGALIDSASQTTNIANVSLAKLRPLPFPLPPLAEQARIVARVDELMRLCDALETKGRLEAEQHARLLSTLLGTLTDSTTPAEMAANWQRVAEHFDLLLDRPEAVDALEQTILQLAVRGVLVPQDPNDEPVVQALHSVPCEQARIPSGAAVSAEVGQNPLVGRQPYEIPTTWAWVPLGDVVEIIRGITFPASEKTREAAPGRIACLRTANVQDAIEWDDLLFVDRKFMGRNDQLLRPHDIVMSMANSRELVGKVALVEHVPHMEATFGGFLGVIRAPGLEPGFVMAFLQSRDARSMLIDSSSQTTNIANISLGKLRPLPFPLPPRAEQARIVARIGELRRLWTDLRQRLKASQAVQSHLADALVEQTVA